MSGWVSLVEGLMCLAQGHNAVKPVISSLIRFLKAVTRVENVFCCKFLAGKLCVS